MKISYTARALADLEEIADFLKPLSLRGALNVRAEIRATIENLALFPRMGRAQTAPGVRKSLTRRYKYKIYYTFDESVSEVVIISIRHPSRDQAFDDL